MNGVYYYEFGIPEKVVPSSVHRDKLDQKRCSGFDGTAPFVQEDIIFKKTARGCTLTLPMEDSEAVFGLGLQLKSLNQTGKKKTLRVNADPVADSGDSHAPCPFYVSTAGYAVLVDTARYASFYMGSHTRIGQSNADEACGTAADNLDDLYASRTVSGKHVTVDIPAAEGIGIYVFAGPTMREAVMRCNMFSGGGYLPPMWGLGIWYRAWTCADQEKVKGLCREFREEGIPCDVFGLEPWWQSRRYPCSYMFSSETFPNPDELISSLAEQNFHLNLWEHVFVHPESPVYAPLFERSGNYEVWGGLVPDLSLPEARDIFASHHKKEFVDKGISGFKLDECDNSDFTNGWSFPEVSEFPSGMDGEQMHCLLGGLYQRTILKAFEDSNRRTMGAARSSGPFMSDMPFILPSDLYDHKDFIRGLVTAGFSGMSWTPEVRQTVSLEDFYRRVETVLFSPMALINGWMIPHPPWKQFDAELNAQGIFLDNHEEVRDDMRYLFGLRMSFVPYLYTAYRKYETTGLTPFRALVMDYPDDEKTYDCDLQYLMGEDLMIAPLVAGETVRSVYFPKGTWYDFYTNKPIEGGQQIDIEADLKTIPIFVKEGTLLPFAAPVDCFKKDGALDISFRRFGSGTLSCTLFEDDGESYDYRAGAYNTVTAVWSDGTDKPEITRKGNYPARYRF